MTMKSDPPRAGLRKSDKTPEKPAKTGKNRFTMRIWHQLVAIGLAFLLPLAIAVAGLVSQQRQRIDFAQYERYGIEYLRPLSSLTESLSTHRSQVRRVAAGTEAAAKMKNLEQVIDSQFAALEKTDKRLASWLKTDKRALADEGRQELSPSAIADRWTAIRNTPDPRGKIAGDTIVLNRLMQLTSYVGDSSKLILDPDLDTYYTMTSLLLWEPQIFDQVGRLADAAEPLLNKKQISDAESVELLNVSSNIGQNMEQLRNAIDRAIKETPHFNQDKDLRSAVEPLLSTATSSIDKLLRATERLASGKAEASVSPAQYTSMVTDAQTAHAGLWKTLLAQEDDMLRARQVSLEEQDRWVLSGVALAVLMVTALTVFLARRMARNVGSISDAARELAAGNLNERASVRSGDEIGSMAASFNTMADRLQESYEAIELKIRQRTGQLRRRTESLSVLQQVTAAANTSETWEAALHTVLPLVCRHMGWHAGHAYLEELADQDDTPRAPELRPSATWYTEGDDPGIEMTMQHLARLSDSSTAALPRATLTSGEPGFAGAADETWQVPVPAGTETLRGRVTVPVWVGTEVAAVLDFLTPEDTRPPDEARRLLMDVATQLGRVVERERAEVALRRSVQAAEAAARAKSAFLATMSHEIRTPMNGVIGMTELLLDTNMTTEQRQFAEIVYSSADSLLSIINDILDFSKFEAGKIELEAIPVDIRSCIESAFDVVATKAAEKEELELAYIIDPQMPDEIITDGNRLRQILVNLLSNAVKFTAAGEVILTLSHEPSGNDEPLPISQENGDSGGTAPPSPPNDIKLHFAVRDTGIGIPADRADHLFEPFEQVDSSTTRRFGGTGLGLAISKRLVELMGGEIWVESEIDVGSTFHFTVVCHKVPLEMRMRQMKPLEELVGKRLLVVDDNPTNRMILTHQATSWGMRVRATGLQSEALQWISTGDPFDIGILDMQMPGMDGITLSREIRHYRGREKLPLLLLTSVGRPDVPASELEEFASYHPKPVRARLLYEGLCHALGHPEEVPASGREGRRPSSHEVDAASPEAAERIKMRILLAEDNAVNRQLAIRMLDKLGYTADAVENGVQALEAIARKPYDVVLMDVHMPLMSGLEATRRLHQETPADRRPKIVALTASVMTEDREECLDAGMDEFLSKPLNRDALAAVLESIRLDIPPGPAESAPSGQSRQEPPPEAADVIDVTVIKDLEESSDAEFVAALIDAFLEDSPDLVHMIEQGIAEGDADRIRMGAHTLKSNAGTFGIRDLVPLCQTAENYGAAGDCEKASEVFPKIRQLYEQASRRLSNIRSELST